MEETWTLPELVAAARREIEGLPPPKNGQVRAVPDERTVRYYATLGLLDRPRAMRGRTALYGRKHLAQVVAIKRLQHAGKSLAEIQAAWPTLDPETLSRMSGVRVPAEPRPPAPARAFWKQHPVARTGQPEPEPEPEIGVEHEHEHDRARVAVELRLELAPDITLALALADERVALTPAEVRAIRAAAAPLLAELAHRGLTPHPGGPR